MADLQTLANLADVLSGATVIGGVVFAVLQIREFRTQRTATSAIELIQSIRGTEYARAISLAERLPDGISLAELHEIGGEAEEAVTMLCIVYETIGLATHRRVVPFSLVQDLVGGVVISAWKKLHVWVEDCRETRGDTWFEWFQWLAERMEESGTMRGGRAANVQFRDWRPRD
jgi:hypothetical protein